MGLGPRVFGSKAIGNTNHGRTVEIREGAGGVAHLQAVAHEEAAAEDEDYQRAASVLGGSPWTVDADFGFVAIAHGDRARLFVAAGGDCFGGLLLFDGEASLAEGLDDGV